MGHQTSCSPYVPRYTYDVFLSFRGEDTRYGFTGNLYSALSKRGIFTFIDDAALRKGQEITPSLRNAIQESRISIVILSKNYASSTFCLDELVHILDCYTKHNMWVLPVFYDIDPSHVRHQTGSYQEAFAKHELGRFKDNIEKVKQWRLALCQAADLSGLHFKIGEEYESEFIKKITEEVSTKLNRRLLHIANYPVGLQARIQQIQWFMGADFDNKVTMLGIHGMGGIGKSTLARAIYNLIAHQFEGSCFVANVREKSTTKYGLVQIQETMLSELVGETDIKLGDVNQGIPLLQCRLCQKKVLVVVDDINKKEQLEAIAGGPDWFGRGSIIIITTRDKKLLDTHGVEKLYEVNELDDIEALELFTRNAFRNKGVDLIYMELIVRARYYACGVPLALEIIGSNLFGKTLEEWDSALKEYHRIPNRDVQEILRISYDSLEDNEKDIFLDIACFFRGCSLIYITDNLEARGLHAKFHIKVLEEKSFIKIDRYNGELVMMHDLIQSMGREIVRQQSNVPENRKRLWFYKDIVGVLEKNKENNEIEAMLLEMPKDQDIQWDKKVFGKLNNLRMLIMINNAGSVWSPEVLPNSLEVLEWSGYPATSLPSKFQLKNLVRLVISNRYFQWDKTLQNSKVLRHLILIGCKNIIRLPDVSGSPNLKELCVCECTNLTVIHDSVGSLHNLELFCAAGCTKLKIAPRGLKMTSLESLNFRDCCSLVIFPEILSPMQKLKIVHLDGTAIKNLPLSMKNLEALQILSLTRCKMLESEPSNFLQNLPEFFPNLKELYLSNINLTILPVCFEDWVSLQKIIVTNCKQLKEIKGLPPSIMYLDAKNTALETNSVSLNMLLRWAFEFTSMKCSIMPSQRIPKWFDHFSREKSLHFWFRNELPSLTICVVSGIVENNLGQFNFNIKVNGIPVQAFCYTLNPEICPFEDDHMIIVNFTNYSSMNFDIEEALKTNAWISGEVSVVMTAPEQVSSCLNVIKWTGVYVNRTFSRMENVWFTDSHEVAGTIDLCNNKEAFLCNQAMVSSFAEMESASGQGEIGTLMSKVSKQFTHGISEKCTMEGDMSFLERKCKDSCLTLNLRDEMFGEVNKTFVKKFASELGPTWQLVDAKGNQHFVQFNQCMKKPRIIDGWLSIREFYNLDGDHIVMLIYFGNSLFQLTVFRTNSLPISFPKWHSRYRNNPKSALFRVTLTEYSVRGSYLGLPYTFGKFVRKRGFRSIHLFPDNDIRPVKCKVIINHERKSVKLEKKWKNFVAKYKYNLADRDELLFEFVNPRENMANVYKV